MNHRVRSNFDENKIVYVPVDIYLRWLMCISEYVKVNIRVFMSSLLQNSTLLVFPNFTTKFTKRVLYIKKKEKKRR